MDFVKTLPVLVSAFDKAEIRYALIGGLAMALHGFQRTTLDADFILLADDLEKCDSILTDMGYQRHYHSENVSHYGSKDIQMGRVDLLHAFRPASLGMLSRAVRLPLTSNCSIPVVQIEDIIGLKVQAACNDTSRAAKDWNDIYCLARHAGARGSCLDWALLEDYLGLFGEAEKLESLKHAHGTP